MRAQNVEDLRHRGAQSVLKYSGAVNVHVQLRNFGLPPMVRRYVPNYSRRALRLVRSTSEQRAYSRGLFTRFRISLEVQVDGRLV